MDTAAGLDQQRRRRMSREPATLAVVAFAVAVTVALTAPSSADPPQRIGVALAIGGIVFAAATSTGHRWLVIVGAGSMLAGVLLMVDGQRFAPTVSRGFAAATVLVGLVVARSAQRRIGLWAALVTMAAFVGAGSLFVAYDRELLSLSLGIIGFGVLVIAVVGLVRASDADATFAPRLRVSHVLSLGVGAVVERASVAGHGESIRDKVLYEGDERPRRYFRFLMLMGFASAIASLGIIADSTAVVIGAMLVAPLLTPLMGMSLSLVMGWTAEIGRAAIVAGSGMLVAVATGFITSAVVGRGTDVGVNTQILSRSSPTLLDLGIALAAGAAGAYALSRTDVSDALPGVAVAIALVPPLAVVGVAAQLGAGPESTGALILFVTNALAILAMGSLTFVVTGTAATEANKNWDLDWWTVALGATTVVVLGALVANTSAANESGARTDISTDIVETWINGRDYEILSISVDDSLVDIVLTGPEQPSDTDELADSLNTVLGGSVSVELKIALTDRIRIEPDE